MKITIRKKRTTRSHDTPYRVLAAVKQPTTAPKGRVSKYNRIFQKAAGVPKMWIPVVCKDAATQQNIYQAAYNQGLAVKQRGLVLYVKGRGR